MKLPRDTTAAELIKSLVKLGYTPTRQVGSHIRLSNSVNGQHHVTVPNHVPLKVGTLSSLLKEIAAHHQLTKAELLKQLFE